MQSVEVSSPVGTPRTTARLAMPAQTAPLVARQSVSRVTGPLVLVPPPLGKYIYWDKRASGYKLDYKKRNSNSLSGFDYLYLGYWSMADLINIMTELSPGEAVQVFLAEANRNAKLYLKRKRERDNNA